jgi:hypothetical protein
VSSPVKYCHDLLLLRFTIYPHPIPHKAGSISATAIFVLEKQLFVVNHIISLIINIPKNTKGNKLGNMYFKTIDVYSKYIAVKLYTVTLIGTFDIFAKLLMVNRLHMGFSVSGVFRLFLFIIPFPIKIVIMVDDNSPIRYIIPFMSAFIIENIKK